MKIFKILLFSLISNLAFGQIPNGSFDNWTNANGYDVPTDWDNLNPITHNSNIYTCIQYSPGYVGSSFLTLMTMNVPGKGIVPGRVVSGKIDTITYLPISGYPFTSRPQKLNYSMQFMPASQDDSVYVSVLLTKWNMSISQRDTVAYGANYYYSMAHQWFNDFCYLNYQSGDNPDSAMIVISSSSHTPLESSYIYIDNLQFSGAVTAIFDTQSNNDNFSIYPNPTTDNINIVSNSNEKFSLNIFNSLGEKVYSVKATSNFKLETSNFTSGLYIIQINTNKSQFTKKIIKQ